MPKSLKQYLKDTDNENILEAYELELTEERREKARIRAKERYDAGKEALKNTETN